MIILITAALILFGIKVAPRGTFFENDFSVSQTRALKGLFALIVMFHHLNGTVWSFTSLSYFQNVGILMVGGFFMISGYGLMYGVKNKQNYLRGFFRKRVLPLIIIYYMIDIWYIAIQYVNMADRAQFKRYVIESLFGLQLWFVPVMVVLYVLFRIAFIGHEKRVNKLISPIILTCLTLLAIVMFSVTQHMGINVLYGSNWNDTAFCFVIGMWYCIVKDKLRPFVCKYYYLITALCIVIFAFFFYKVSNLPTGYEWPTKTATILYKETAAIFFCFIILLLSMKFSIGNGLLNIYGDLSFEIYLSHAIFITLFRWNKLLHIPLGKLSFDYLLYIQSDDLYLAAILVGSFIFSLVIHKLSKLIMKPILATIRK